MVNHNTTYKRFIIEKENVSPLQIVRNGFYIIKGYKDVDGQTFSYGENEAPIIYTIFVSKAKNIVHCVKISNVQPKLIKPFFEKFLNEEKTKLEIKGRGKGVYNKIVKFPLITDECYRTYLLSGIKKISAISFDLTKITKSATQEDKEVVQKVKKEKILPKSKIQPKAKKEPIPKIQPIKKKK